MDGRLIESFQHGRKQGPCPDTQGWDANGVCVEEYLVVGMRGIAQTARTYCIPEIILNRLYRRVHKTYHFPRVEHRTAPRPCLRGPAVEALASYEVTESHPRIVREDDRKGHGSREEWISRVAWTGNKWLR